VPAAKTLHYLPDVPRSKDLKLLAMRATSVDGDSEKGDKVTYMRVYFSFCTSTIHRLAHLTPEGELDPIMAIELFPPPTPLSEGDDVMRQPRRNGWAGEGSSSGSVVLACRTTSPCMG